MLVLRGAPPGQGGIKILAVSLCCGCPCEYAAYVPAVFGPSFSSSTEWWRFLLLQILVRTVHTVQDRGLSLVQFWLGVTRLLLCNNRCSGWSRRKLWSPAVAVVGRRPVLGQSRCARWCNDWGRAMLGSTVDTCSAYPGWLMEEFVRSST